MAKCSRTRLTEDKVNHHLVKRYTLVAVQIVSVYGYYKKQDHQQSKQLLTTLSHTPLRAALYSLFTKSNRNILEKHEKIKIKQPFSTSLKFYYRLMLLYKK